MESTKFEGSDKKFSQFVDEEKTLYAQTLPIWVGCFMFNGKLSLSSVCAAKVWIPIIRTRERFYVRRITKTLLWRNAKCAFYPCKKCGYAKIIFKFWRFLNFKKVFLCQKKLKSKYTFLKMSLKILHVHKKCCKFLNYWEIFYTLCSPWLFKEIELNIETVKFNWKLIQNYSW